MHQGAIYLCAGGTGGHLFPAIAAARVLKEQQPTLTITILSDKKVDEKGLLSRQLRIPRRSKKMHLPLFVLALITTFLKCLYLFWKTKPDLVVGFGGYPSVPPVLAAQLLNIPTLLHEQNAVLGRANRYLLRWVSLVAVSFEKTLHITKKIPHIVTGNPVRITTCSPYEPTYDHLNLLVLGSSQGAAIFSTLMPKALALLTQEERDKISLTQQCRSELMDVTKNALSDLGMNAVTLAPFFDSMQNLYERADLVIARSGASTVAEVTVAGRAAFFVPYPYAMDNHQYYNAKTLCEKGGGRACDFMEQREVTPEKLSDVLRDCLNNPDMLKNKAQAVQQYSMVEAASHLARVIVDLLPSTLRVT